MRWAISTSRRPWSGLSEGRARSEGRFSLLGPRGNEYLQGWAANDRPAHLQELFIAGQVTPERREAVILAQVLGDVVNSGYDSGWVGAPVVSKVNGAQARSLES